MRSVEVIKRDYFRSPTLDGMSDSQPVLDSNCRFCGHTTETVLHLLTNCIDPSGFFASHGVSRQNLANESIDNILHFAQIDQWLRNVLPIDQQPAAHGFSTNLTQELSRRKQPRDPGDMANIQPPSKRTWRLVAYHDDLPRNFIRKQKQPPGSSPPTKRHIPSSQQ